MHHAAIAVLFVSAAALSAGESLVVLGAGSIASWTTQLDFANPTDGQVIVSIDVDELHTTPGECLPLCPTYFAAIPPKGTFGFRLPGTTLDSPELRTLFITLIDGPALPTVRAENVNTDSSEQNIILPVVRLSTLVARGSGTLAFPAATRTDTVHTNLALGAVAGDGSSPQFSARVEIFDRAGALLGSRVYSNIDVLTAGTGTNIFLTDVLDQLGVAALENGQIRVTQLSGQGVLWGAMATLGATGNALLTEGLNP